MIDEMIYNWTGNLNCNKLSNKSQVIAEKAKDLQQRRFSAVDAYDVLCAEYLDDDEVVQAAVNEVYGYDEPEISQETIHAAVVPTRYRDVEAFVENTLLKNSARDFVNMLSEGTHAIVGAASQTLNSIYQTAKKAKAGDRIALNKLHSDLKPWMEEAMLHAVIDAEHHTEHGDVKISESQDINEYRVAVNKGKKIQTAQVSLDNGECDCPRYTEGYYKDFGLACEHVVLAADNCSPYEQLMRAVV